MGQDIQQGATTNNQKDTNGVAAPAAAHKDIRQDQPQDRVYEPPDSLNKEAGAEVEKDSIVISAQGGDNRTGDDEGHRLRNQEPRQERVHDLAITDNQGQTVPHKGGDGVEGDAESPEHGKERVVPTPKARSDREERTQRDVDPRSANPKIIPQTNTTSQKETIGAVEEPSQEKGDTSGTNGNIMVTEDQVGLERSMLWSPPKQAGPKRNLDAIDTNEESEAASEEEGGNGSRYAEGKEGADEGNGSERLRGECPGTTEGDMASVTTKGGRGSPTAQSEAKPGCWSMVPADYYPMGEGIVGRLTGQPEIMRGEED